MIAGVDEAGRGPLAGPVVAAAVILPEGFDPVGINDSKKMTRKAREAAAERIKGCCQWSLALAGPEEIDRLNILWATMAAMERAVQGLPSAPSLVLVDGNRVPPGLAGIGRAIVDGDALEVCISAASILAKTTRDDLMRVAALEYPEYGFDLHFGYAAPIHLKALAEYGPCPIHRASFAPCRPDLQGTLDL